MTMNSRTVSPEEAAAVAENVALKARVTELETIIADLTQDSVPENDNSDIEAESMVIQADLAQDSEDGN